MRRKKKKTNKSIGIINYLSSHGHYINWPNFIQTHTSIAYVQYSLRLSSTIQDTHT